MSIAKELLESMEEEVIDEGEDNKDIAKQIQKMVKRLEGTPGAAAIPMNIAKSLQMGLPRAYFKDVAKAVSKELK